MLLLQNNAMIAVVANGQAKRFMTSHALKDPEAEPSFPQGALRRNRF